MADTATFTYKEMNRGVLSTSDFTVVRSSNGYTISVSSTKERAHQTGTGLRLNLRHASVALSVERRTPIFLSGETPTASNFRAPLKANR